MHTSHRNVNDALFSYLSKLKHEEIDTVTTDSRNGPVIRIEGPVTITYMDPCERVLFNRKRDCNPFFHLVESLWMLAGRDDVATLAFFNSNISKFSDNGQIFHGAYGRRWRDYFPRLNLARCQQSSPKEAGTFDLDALEPIDQLNIIINELRKDPHSSFSPKSTASENFKGMATGELPKFPETYSSRRLVLQMWSPQDDLTLVAECPSCKDVPCNTQAYFDVNENGYLDMTVCNRSNDLVWGCFGANVVHFSFLLEYMANCCGLKVGQYHQFTNNLHVYQSHWDFSKLLNDSTDYYLDGQGPKCTFPLVQDKETFDEECQNVVDLCLDLDHLLSVFNSKLCSEPFLASVAIPMILAFHSHKRRQYHTAQTYLEAVKSLDWRFAGRDWLLKRERLHERDAPYYEG